MNFEMFAKLDENGRIVRPPHNDKNRINVHHSLEWLSAHGFEEHSQEWFDEHTPPPQQTVFTRLQIRRAMRDLGIEEKLDTLLDSSDTFKKDWNDAQDINLADPVYLQALASGSITEQEIEDIKNQINL